MVIIKRGIPVKFCPDRLIQLRTSMNISKAEAARRLNISAMAYGRYEKGEREPSYQSVCYIAQTFHCNVNFLYGISDIVDCDYIVISQSETPELYSLIEIIQQNHAIKDKVMTYAKELNKQQKNT